MDKNLEKTIQEINNYLYDDQKMEKNKIEVLSFSQFKDFIMVNKRHINDTTRGIEICCDTKYFNHRLLYNEILLENIVNYHYIDNAIKLMYAEYCIAVGYLNKTENKECVDRKKV